MWAQSHNNIWNDKIRQKPKTKSSPWHCLQQRKSHPEIYYYTPHKAKHRKLKTPQILFCFKQIERDIDQQWCIWHQGTAPRPPPRRMPQSRSWFDLPSQTQSGSDPKSHWLEVEPLRQKISQVCYSKASLLFVDQPRYLLDLFGQLQINP